MSSINVRNVPRRKPITKDYSARAEKANKEEKYDSLKSMTYFGNGGSECFENNRSKQDFYRPTVHNIPHQHTNRNEIRRQDNSSIILKYNKGWCSIDDVHKVTTSHLKANPKDVGRLMNNLNNANIPANVFVYGAAINAYAKMNLWQDALRLLKEMKQNNIKPDTITFNSAIKACANVGQWEYALNLLQEMEYRGIQFDAITFNSAIIACANGRQLEYALDLFDEMEYLKIPRNTIIYSSAIKACAEVGQWERALDLLDKMDYLEIPRDTITYGFAIKACTKDGQWEYALKLLDVMKQDKIPRDTIIYSSAIEVCAHGRQWEDALKLLEEMKQNKIPRDTITYNSTIKACIEKGKWECVRELLKEMKQDNIQHDAITYSAAISAYFNSNARQQHEVIDLLAEAVKKGIYQPNLGWNSEHTALNLHSAKVLTKQEYDRQVHRAYSPNEAVSKAILLKAMEENKIKPDIEIITGQGEHFELRTNIINYLQQLGIECGVDARNTGRIIIKEVPNAK